MSSQINEIKLEGNELQTYLEAFNNDLEVDGQTITVIQTDGDDVIDDDGTYFVDTSGNYYYQANKALESVLETVESVEYIVDDDTGLSEGNTAVLGSNDKIAKTFAKRSTATTTRGRRNKPAILASKKNSKKFGRGSNNETNYVFVLDEKDNIDPLAEADGTEAVEAEITNGDDPNCVYEFDVDDDTVDMLDEKPSVSDLKIKQTKYASKVHFCDFCNYSSPKRYLLSRHMKCHSDERPHKCAVCERGFKTWASLQNHANTHTGTKPHLCKFCESSFTTSGELVRHVRYKHTHEKPHKCTECDYASVELSKLKRHIRCHTGERPYQCPHCTYASPDTFKLKRHLRIHTGEKPYECDVCQARFTQSNSLKAHKLIHSVGDKPVFHCELCPTTCGRKTDLRIHVQKLHTSEKPLKCKRCGKSFPDRYTYKIHTKTHEGEKCYRCELCPYASISARHLESHMLIHTDQKPFQCGQCDQSFRQKQLLKRHVNLYHNPTYIAPQPKEKTHACPHCERHFRHKGNLIRHMAMHDPLSGAIEESIALKLGRQERIRSVDGSEYPSFITGDEFEEEYEGEEDEEDEEDDQENKPEEDSEATSEFLPSTRRITRSKRPYSPPTDEDNQYMVVEIINGEEQPDINAEITEFDMDEELLSSLDDDSRLQGVARELADTGDMSTCFGFEEDGEMEILQDDKTSIQLL